MTTITHTVPGTNTLDPAAPPVIEPHVPAGIWRDHHGHNHRVMGIAADTNTPGRNVVITVPFDRLTGAQYATRTVGDFLAWVHNTKPSIPAPPTATDQAHAAARGYQPRHTYQGNRPTARR